MTTAIVRHQPHITWDLSHNWIILEEINSAVADRLEDVTVLKEEIRRFEQRFYRELGALRSELDKLTYRIDNPFADPTDPYEEAWNRGEAGAFGFSGGKRPRVKPPPPVVSLKVLYRKIAKLIHPDLARNSKERKARQRYMSEANQAYRIRSEELLQDLLYRWENSPYSVQGTDQEDQLKRVVLLIKNKRGKLIELEMQINEMVSSHMYQAMAQVSQAEAQGHDLFRSWKEEMSQDIEIARSELKRKLRNPYHPDFLHGLGR